MCIVIVKPKGKSLIKRKVLENCFDNNPDGAGFMFLKDNTLTIKKGFMDYDSFIKAIEDTGLNKHMSIIYHFRIGTSAEIKPQYCHPFPISHNYNDLTALNIICSSAVAHNGIIRINSTDKLSDTMMFIQNILSYIPEDKIFNDEQFQKTIGELCNGSKLAFMNSQGDIVLLGEKWIKEDGCYYSNDTFRESYLFNYFGSINKFDFSSYYDKKVKKPAYAPIDKAMCPQCYLDLYDNGVYYECPNNHIFDKEEGLTWY